MNQAASSIVVMNIATTIKATNVIATITNPTIVINTINTTIILDAMTRTEGQQVLQKESLLQALSLQEKEQ
jgi:hypothetical protein